VEISLPGKVNPGNPPQELIIVSQKRAQDIRTNINKGQPCVLEIIFQSILNSKLGSRDDTVTI